MTRDELERYIAVASMGVCVDRSMVAAFPGLVREVSIRKDLSVVIEINPYGYDEGGARYRGQYDELDDLIAELGEA